MLNTGKKLSKSLGKVVAIAAFSVLMTNVAQAKDLKFELINASKSTIKAFYVSPTKSNDWEENILEGQTLAPNETMDITLSDYNTCKFDMRFEFKGDRLGTFEDTQNICELSSYTVEE